MDFKQLVNPFLDDSGNAFAFAALDKEWVLQITHVDIQPFPAVTTIVAFNPYRIKLTIYLDNPGTVPLLGQRPDFLNIGGPVGIALTQYMTGIERDICCDGRECTDAWYGTNTGAGTPCLYVSEVIYRGYPKNTCKQQIGDDDATRERLQDWVHYANNFLDSKCVDSSSSPLQQKESSTPYP